VLKRVKQMYVAYSENKSENRCTSNGFRRKGWKRTHEMHTERAGVKNVVANVEVCAAEYRHRKGIKAYLTCTQKHTAQTCVLSAYRYTNGGNCISAASRHGKWERKVQISCL